MALSANINLYLITVIKYVKETLSLLFIATTVRDSALQQVTQRMTSTLWSPGSVCWRERPARSGPCPWGAVPGLSSLPEVMLSGH